MNREKTENRKQKSEIGNQTRAHWSLMSGRSSLLFRRRPPTSDFRPLICDLRSLAPSFGALLLAPCSLRLVLVAWIFVVELLFGVALAVEGDIVFSRKPDLGAEPPPSVFPHWVHRIRFKCYVCHDAIFKMKKGANPITMEALMAGRYCAVCHNGSISWPVGFETCQRCHVRP